MIPIGLSRTSGLVCSREITSLLCCTTCEDLKHWCPVCRDLPPHHTFTSSQCPGWSDSVRPHVDVCVDAHACETGMQPQPWHFSLTVILGICSLNYFAMYFLPWIIIKLWEILIFHMTPNPYDFQGAPWVLYFPMDVPVLCFSCLRQFSRMTRRSSAPTRERSLFIR